jgi:DNA-binding CsgD family transcriptional regulator
MASQGSFPEPSREAEVVPMLSAGLSNKEIGDKLGISERTVKFHVANVFAKVGAHDRRSAAELARSLPSPKAGFHPPAQPLSVKPQKAGPLRIRSFPS